MADETRKSWRTFRRELPLNEKRVQAYERLMEAERRLDEVRRRRGLGEDTLDQALQAALAEEPSGEGEDVYLATLARYVSALGGHLEVVAVFPEETIPLTGAPEPPDQPGG